MLRVAYIRVSTSSGEQLAALETQRSRIRGLAPSLVLEDVESGLNPERIQYGQLKHLIQTGQVEEVLATRLDRLGRDATESDAFVRLCDRHGVVCRCLDDGVVTMVTPEDLLLTRLKGSLSEGESMKIAQRVNKALAEGRLMGKPMRKPCWGYRLSADRSQMEIDPIEGPAAQAFIAHLKACGWQINTGLATFDGLSAIKTRMGVRVWLLNPTLRGGVPYGKQPNGRHEQVLWEQHPPLISAEDFIAATAALERNRKLWGSNHKRRLRALTGLCVCVHCGTRMRYIPRRVTPSLACFGEDCCRPYRGSRENDVLEAVIDSLSQRAAARMAGLVTDDEHPEATRLKTQIAALERQGDPDLSEAIKRKQQRLKGLLQQPVIDPDLERKIADRAWFDLLSYDELTAVVQQLIREIRLANGEPQAIDLKL
jgi:DNA invertase Pin-like site-specific DNA recombinase